MARTPITIATVVEVDGLASVRPPVAGHKSMDLSVATHNGLHHSFSIDCWQKCVIMGSCVCVCVCVY